MTFLASFLALAGLLPLPSQNPGGTLAFRDVRVFDGERVLDHQTVLVEGGRIAGLGPALEIPAGARIVEGAGRTLLPGLIDAHTHVLALDDLRQALVFGVTTECDMFMAPDLMASIKKRLAAGKARDAADLRSAGFLVTAPGGHGTEYGLPIPTMEKPDQAQAMVDARIEEGSDYIKIVYDDGRAYGIDFPTLSRETLRAVIRAAHARHKLAVVHIGSVREAREALEAGADGLTHLPADAEPQTDLAALAARRGAFVIPTLTVLESSSGVQGSAPYLQRQSIASLLAPARAARVRASMPFGKPDPAILREAEKGARALREAGVPVLAGTDATNPGCGHGISLHRELELLVASGFSPREALRAATSAPAAAFALTDRGRIRPGLRADLLLVRGDPTRDIAATRDIVGVWKEGRAVDREGFRKAVGELRLRAASSAQQNPRAPEAGTISRFEGGQVAADFGAGWIASTDRRMGGHSTVAFSVVEGGAAGSKGSLEVSGELAPAGPVSWSGVLFSPGSAPMGPADLSAKKKITFWVRGDGRTYAIMLFTRTKGFQPILRTFEAGPEWKRLEFPFQAFDGTDGHDVMGIFWGASGGKGPFRFQLDEVALQ